MKLTVALFLLTCPSWCQSKLGIFEDHGDVGAVLHPGSVDYNSSSQTYTVTGSGENMWFAMDTFQFVWKKVSGDVTLTADVSFLGEGKEAHRKAVLMIRQSLDADSPYADIARHGDGLTSLQARDEQGAITTEIQSATRAPARLRIAKRGDQFYIYVAAAGEDLRFSGGSMRVPMHGPFYVGVGVCSHNKDVVERAVFSKVELSTPAAGETNALYSTLEVVPMSGDRRTVFVTPGRISAPQFTPDGDYLNFRHQEHFERLPVSGGQPQIAPATPPTPAGEYRYIHSNQSGSFQIWRMPKREGLPEQVTSDNYQNCFPQLSPNGELLAFVSYMSDKPAIPVDTDVLLRVISLKDKKLRTLARLIGGQGTLDAPSWSPDSKRLAFVSYQPAVPDPGASTANNWGPVQFLIGKWTGEGDGKPGSGSGSFSLLPDLQGKILVRKSFAEYPPANGKAGFRHDDLMIIYRAEGSRDLHATYYDSEGHVIDYAVQPVDHGVAFVSDGYKLTYFSVGDQRVKLKLEIVRPGGGFTTYIEAGLRREP